MLKRLKPSTVREVQLVQKLIYVLRFGSPSYRRHVRGTVDHASEAFLRGFDVDSIRAHAAANPSVRSIIFVSVFLPGTALTMILTLRVYQFRAGQVWSGHSRSKPLIKPDVTG